MKKLHLWSMLVVTMMASVCVALSSCGGDDDSDDNSPAANLDLTGTWMCTGSIDSWDGGSKTDLMVGKILVVKADNTYTSTSSNMGNGAYTLLGNKLTAISTTGKVITATVSLSGNKLEMEGTTNDGVRFIYTFKRVTDDNGGGTGEASMMKEWMEKPLGNVNVSLKTGSYQAIKNGVRPETAGFTVPLCATIHMPCSILKITAVAYAISLSMGLPCDFGTYIGFIMMLAITMVAAPGVPGGAIMAALGLLGSMLGFDANLQGLMIAIYIAMDSFGTAGNVTGDGAIALIVDHIRGDKA